MSNARTLASLIDGSNIVVPGGYGLDFGTTADGTGSVTSGLMDDYEEGSWTPVYTPTTGAFGTYTADLEYGRYTKVGNLVNCAFILRTDALTVGTASSAIRLSGLPFTNRSASAVAVNIGYSNYFASGHPASGYITGQNSYVVLTKRNFTTGSLYITLQPSDLGTGENANYIIGSITYNT